MHKDNHPIMKKTFLFVALAATLILTSCKGGSDNQPGASNVKLNSQSDTLSWVMGEYAARTILSTNMAYDQDMVLKAMKAILNGEASPLDDETFSMVLDNMNTQVMLQQQQEIAEQREAADKQEQAYFKKLEKDNPNVKKAPEGFYYEVIKKGHGPNAQYRQVVFFDYKAYFTNGQLFDQTYGNREPITHVVGNPMFQGMQKAFTYMNAGSTYRFYFPYELAFGVNGTEDIPPCTTIIYEIELHEVRDF